MDSSFKFFAENTVIELWGAIITNAEAIVAIATKYWISPYSSGEICDARKNQNAEAIIEPMISAPPINDNPRKLLKANKKWNVL